jgi:hypothetical protein
MKQIAFAQQFVLTGPRKVAPCRIKMEADGYLPNTLRENHGAWFHRFQNSHFSPGCNPLDLRGAKLRISGFQKELFLESPTAAWFEMSRALMGL